MYKVLNTLIRRLVLEFNLECRIVINFTLELTWLWDNCRVGIFNSLAFIINFVINFMQTFQSLNTFFLLYISNLLRF